MSKATCRLSITAAFRFGLAWVLMHTAIGQGQIYTVLHEFDTHGWGIGPAPTITASETHLFGAYQASPNGCLFKLGITGGSYEILHDEPGATDGWWPSGSLLLSGTTLYGSTIRGGRYARGTIFRINTDGSGFAVLLDFAGPNGAEPRGPLALSGNTLFGTTCNGGAWGDGTVFRVQTDGTGFQVLKSFSFTNDADGCWPQGGVILSGKTLYGNLFRNARVMGSIFSIEEDGSNFRTLHHFYGLEGDSPLTPLVLDADTLYGTTAAALFQVKTNGTNFRVCWYFAFDGAWNPVGGLALAGKKLYGTTANDGEHRFGIFEFDRLSGAYRELYSATGSVCSCVTYRNGDLFGTTYGGQTGYSGLVFRCSISPPQIISPPQSTTGETGSTVGFSVRADGSAPLAYQWLFNGNPLSRCTGTTMVLSGIQPADVGPYSVRVSNACGVVTSTPAMLSVIPKVERRPVAALTVDGTLGQTLNLETSAAPQPGPDWVPLDTVTLTNAGQFYLDLSAPVSGQRYYRAWQAQGSGPAPAVEVHLIPAIKLTGAVGSSARIDYINQFGPTDAWATLATVTLTNMSQEYFDTSVIGQPARLYRLSNVPALTP